MEKFLTDIHTHSTFSHDGRNSLTEMVAAAREKGVCFYGVSEHLDYDVFLQTFKETDKGSDAEAYFRYARHLQEDYAGALNLLVGYEFGYTDDKKGHAMYAATADKYRPDFIVNSVHTNHGVDYYRGSPYYTVNQNGERTVRDKDEVYAEYLSLIRRSLDVEYPYDIVGHIGYVTRYAPYADKSLSLKRHSGQVEDILRTIIAKGKILEVNSSNKGGVTPYLPQRDIVELYFSLGGRRISYASDAHFTERILDGRATVVQMLKEIGFTYLTVPCAGEYIKVEI